MSRKAHNSAQKEYFISIYKEYSDKIFRHALFKLSDREKAKDVVQDTFVRLWEYIVVEKEIQNVQALLFRMATNLIIDSYRRKKSISLDALIDDGYDSTDDNKSQRQAFDAAEHRLVIEALNLLEPDQRDLLSLRYIDDLSVQEIALMTGERENTVSVRIHRALKHLQDTMKKD
jgi:RNA polymerase sigma-70 factor (ECF subfamily)